jgi:SAM-dependent methyltransferase
MAPVDLPLPPESLRVWVGPFSNAELFARSGEEMARSIIASCHACPNSRILEVGCGCGRLSRAFAGYLSSAGSYAGFDVAPVLIEWCKQHLEPLLPNFRFSLADLRAAAHNPTGAMAASRFRFPFAANAFDVAVVSSVFTHMLAEEIENYVAELTRVLQAGGYCFMTVFLFDADADRAVAAGTTAFDFRHAIGPCLTFDRECPQEGVACRKQWFLELLDRSGFRLDPVRSGNWRQVRSYEISQDVVVARKHS